MLIEIVCLVVSSGSITETKMVLTHFYSTQMLGVSVKCPMLTLGPTRAHVYWIHLPRVKWTEVWRQLPVVRLVPYLHVISRR